MRRLSHVKARDGNELEIVQALQKLGASVIRLDGPVDLLVGYRRTNYLIEVKLPAGPKGGLKNRHPTDGQQRFFATWGGSYALVRSVGEAFAAIGAIDSSMRQTREVAI